MNKIDWIDIKVAVPSVSGREYLVANILNDEAKYVLCKYYRKGDVAWLNLKEECAPEPKTTEEKLLRSIFGTSRKKVIIEKEGFYSIVCCPYSMENTDCYDDLAFEGGPSDKDEDWEDNVYWAELPCAPEGIVHPYDRKSLKDKIKEKYSNKNNSTNKEME